MQKEIRVRKANRIVRVSENELAKYTAMGYDVIDDTGSVVQAGVPHDPNTLKKAFIDHENTIQKLKAENETLKAMIKELSVNQPKTGDIEQPTKRRSKKTQD